jgi:hypothetical protein
VQGGDIGVVGERADERVLTSARAENEDSHGQSLSRSRPDPAATAGPSPAGKPSRDSVGAAGA